MKTKDEFLTWLLLGAGVENDRVRNLIYNTAKDFFSVKADKKNIPTLDQIKDYCSQRNSVVDPVQFFNFYESKGWMVGKTKMQSWKAAIANWEITINKKNNGNTKYKQNPTERQLESIRNY